MNKKVIRNLKSGLGIAAIAAALSAQTVLAAVPESIWECAQYYDSGNIVLQFAEVETRLPESWDGQFEYEIFEGDGMTSVCFYQTASREAGEKEGYKMGSLFNLCCADNYDFMDYLPNYTVIGSGEHGVYYISLPTDVQGYQGDATAAARWSEMFADTDWVIENTVINVPGEGMVDEENLAEDMESVSGNYILEDSSSRKLSAADVNGLNVNQLQMAINEIYARHGRKFVTQSIQEYFDSKSWYNGTVEADAFDPAVLTPIEQENIAFLMDSMNQGRSSEGNGSSADAVDYTQKMYAVVDVNLRSQASTGASILTTVPLGEEVQASGTEQNGWMPVSYQGLTGYISAQYLSTAQPASSAGTAQSGSVHEELSAGGMFASDGVQTSDSSGMGYAHGTVLTRDGNSFTIETADGTQIALTFMPEKLDYAAEGYSDGIQPGVTVDVVFNRTSGDVELLTIL
ncbi:MAG: YARHG domain-containing protein [Eubacteriales bacterium]|nr:YARHG domain-containing protein [Eubacteriales bacterium]